MNVKTLPWIWLALVLAGCQTLPYGHVRTIRNARITWYCNHEDKFGSRTACGGQAQEGRTVAANSTFPFGTRLIIPALRPLVGSARFVVEDRGSAVEARRAAAHGEDVFDVYLAAKNRRAGIRRIRQLGSCLTHADVFLE